jgi:two-component system, OmpR family, response regulator CpxR
MQRENRGGVVMKITVLLVDDERNFVNALAERLEIRDFEILKAFDGDEALGKIADANVDVVILDVQMPGKDGLATLREIKKAKPLVEVIMLTGHATVPSAIEGLQNGAYDFLMKPTETKDLVAKIALAYKRKAEQEERIRQAQIENIMMRRGWT